jgi:hypothetical protein|tara:strand:- start:387 stop:857 length:471 start_codon:yes stop_codon:yes gene_type:complete
MTLSKLKNAPTSKGIIKKRLIAGAMLLAWIISCAVSLYWLDRFDDHPLSLLGGFLLGLMSAMLSLGWIVNYFASLFYIDNEKLASIIESHKQLTGAAVESDWPDVADAKVYIEAVRVMGRDFTVGEHDAIKSLAKRVSKNLEKEAAYKQLSSTQLR